MVGNIENCTRTKRSSRNFQPSSSYRKFKAICASPNRYFTENSLCMGAPVSNCGSLLSVLIGHEDNQPYIFGSVIMKTKLASNYYFGNKLIIQKDLRSPKESVQRWIQTVLSRKLFLKNQFPPKPFLCQVDIILVTMNTFNCLLVFSERNSHRRAYQSCKYSTQNKL